MNYSHKIKCFGIVFAEIAIVGRGRRTSLKSVSGAQHVTGNAENVWRIALNARGSCC